MALLPNRLYGNDLARFAALLLGLVALALPVSGPAAWLASGDPHRGAEVTAGLWLFKGLLLAHAGLLAWWGKLGARRGGGPLLGGEALADPPVTGAETGLAVGIVALGLLLRLPGLGDGLWFDEIQTLVEYVRLPLARIVTTFDSQNQHLLYTVSAHAAVSWFGESGWALRLPAVLFGAASLWGVWRLGRLVAPPQEALFAAALLAASYHHVWFSQNARGYTGLLLWSLLGSLCLLRLLAGRYRDARGWIVGYAAAMALAVYTHATAALVAAAHALVLLGLVIRADSDTRRGMARYPMLALGLAASLSLLLYAPVLPQLLETLLAKPAGGVTTAWQSPLWLAGEALRGLARGLPGGWVALGLGGLVVLAGLASYARQSGAVLAVMVLPVLVTLAAIVALGHNLWPRFFFFAAGFGVLIAVRGMFVLARALWPARGPALATAAMSAGVLASALTVPRAWGPKQDYEGAARFLERELGPGDAAVVVDLTEYPYRRYLGRPWAAVTGAAELEAVERAHARTWLLYTFPVRLAAVHPDIWARLEERYQRVAVFPGTVGGGDIVIMVNRPPDAARSPA